MTAPYPAGNSRTPSPQPYLPYPVQSVKQSKKDIIKPSAPGSVWFDIYEADKHLGAVEVWGKIVSKEENN